MTKLYATFDGQVLLPEEPLSLPPNTRVRLLLEPAGPALEALTAADHFRQAGFQALLLAD